MLCFVVVCLLLIVSLAVLSFVGDYRQWRLFSHLLSLPAIVTDLTQTQTLYLYRTVRGPKGEILFSIRNFFVVVILLLTRNVAS